MAYGPRIHHLGCQVPVPLGKEKMAGTLSAKIHHFWRIQKETEWVSWKVFFNTFNFFIDSSARQPYSWSSKVEKKKSSKVESELKTSSVKRTNEAF